MSLYSSEEKREGEAGPSSAASSSNSGGFDFDVFLSFRGADTRGGFTSHLYKELNRLGISTFMDSKDLHRGEKISELFRYMEASQFFVPILSKKYAESKWCLLEAAKMVKLHEADKRNRGIIPVFYDVDPFHVKSEGASFQTAVTKHQNNGNLDEKKVEECKSALKKIGQIAGYSPVIDTNGNEGELVTRIRKRVEELLGRVPFGTLAVGIDARIDVVIKMLERKTNGVCMIGICGSGGIGKTTTAKAIYDKLSSKFEGNSFISDVREAANDHKGLPSLQTNLLCDVLNEESICVRTVEEGMNTIKQRLRRKRVLIVLDDIDHNNQLDALVGDQICHNREDLFGSGSKIIVTTRDKAILFRHGLTEQEIYYPLKLTHPWSLRLFRLHAFKHERPTLELLELSKKAVEFTGGLPLALVVIGSHLAGMTTTEEWQEEIRKLKRDQHKDIHERLKLSYNRLDFRQQCVFLDIACFLIGSSKEYATYVWEDSGYFPGNAIRVLQEKSLLSIDDKGIFKMHDQIRDMGRRIVEEAGKHDPHIYTRLWDKDDILKVLEDAKGRGNNKIQCITLHGRQDPSVWSMRSACLEPVASMDNLRVLHLTHLHFIEEPLRLPKNLRWLRMEWCDVWGPLLFDDKCSLEKLVVLQLRHCSIWNPTLLRTHKAFKKLKVLEISGGWNRKENPSFGCMPGVVKLVLKDCRRLCKVDKLTSSCEFSSLKTLDLGGCQRLSALPERLAEFTALTELILCDCVSLREIPNSITNLNQLRTLNLRGCWSLECLPQLPSSLFILDASRCVNLRIITDISIPRHLQELSLDGCKLLCDVLGLENLRELQNLKLHNCENLGPNLRGRLLQAMLNHLVGFSASGIYDAQHLYFPLPNTPGIHEVLLHLHLGHHWDESIVVPIQVIAESHDIIFETTRCAKRAHVIAQLYGNYAIDLKNDEELQRHLKDGRRMIRIPTGFHGDYQLESGDIFVGK